MQTVGQPPKGPQAEHPDDEWPPVTSLDFDPCALYAEAERVWLRALAAKGAAQPGNGALPDRNTGQVTVSRSAEDALTWPPGFAGALAQFIYQQAHRPVREVAVVGALGLLAGICGREWCIPGSGLNIYIVLVAPSAIGKEAMHSGISRLIAAAKADYGAAGGFVCFDDFASGPALTKHLLASPRSVNVAGELGHKFAAMAKGTESSMTTLRRALTNLYSKSGRGNVAGGIAYSNQENNVASIEGAAFSLIGETTPGVFFESLDRGMMEDGFMSRFTVIEYNGQRPARNRNRRETPDPELVDWLVAIMRQADQLAAKGAFQDVDHEPSALSMLDSFEDECDERINAAQDDEAQRQMWNRAALKVRRIAALLAVGDQCLFPKVSAAHVEWAVALVRRDIAVFGRRLLSGDVGEGSDDTRERKLLSFLRDYLTAPVPVSYKVKPKMREDGIVPRSYLQVRTASLPAFNNHRQGASRALDDAIRSLIANGKLMEVKHDKVVEMYGFHGKSYRILDV